MRYDDWKLCYPPQYDDPGEYLDMFEPEPNYDREDFADECEREARGQSDCDDRGDT